MKLRKSSFARFQQQIAFEEQQAQFYVNNSEYSSNAWDSSASTAINPSKELTWDKFGWPSHKNSAPQATRQARPSGTGFTSIKMMAQLIHKHVGLGVVRGREGRPFFLISRT